MKITIITPTARLNPRLDATARTLAASLARSKDDIEFEWIVVDELGRTLDQLGVGVVTNLLAGQRTTGTKIIPPLPSVHRKCIDRRPAHNSARNAGLLEATGDYVVFLNDCNVVTPDWFNVARDCALQGRGWKCKTKEMFDMPIPDNGVVRAKDHHDLLRPVPATSAAGACWGAPMAVLREARGFDLAYDGEGRGSDLELTIRLGRLGLTFVTTERAFTIQLRRTKLASEISTNKDAHVANKNRARITRLQGDRARVLPEVIAAGFRDPSTSTANVVGRGDEVLEELDRALGAVVAPPAGETPSVDDTSGVRPSDMRIPLRGFMTADRCLKVLQRVHDPDFDVKYEIVQLNQIRMSSGPGTEVVFRPRDGVDLNELEAEITGDTGDVDVDMPLSQGMPLLADQIVPPLVELAPPDVAAPAISISYTNEASSGAQSASQEHTDEAAASSDAAGPSLMPPATDAPAAPFLTEAENDLADEFDAGGA